MIITPPTPAEVTGHAADMYASDMSDDGFVHTYTQVMAINPEAHQAFEALIRALVSSIGINDREGRSLTTGGYVRGRVGERVAKLRQGGDRAATSPG